MARQRGWRAGEAGGGVNAGGDTPLNRRLSLYATAARTTAAGKLHGRIGTWPVYAAAVGSAMAMATNASASIIYCGPSNNYCDPTGPHHSAPQVSATASGHKFVQPIGLDGAGHFFNLVASAAGSFGIVSAQAPSPVHVFVNGGASSLVRKFMTSAMIGGGPARASAEIVKFGSADSVKGNFQAGQPGFAGLSITSHSLGSGHNQVEYGWIRLEFMDGGNGFPRLLEAIDWAVGSKGETIYAGEQTDAAPEPDTLSLALLASGAAGVTALRRRRTLKTSALSE
jgi:hypothetical protein